MAKKLGFKAGFRAYVKNPPADYDALVAPLPEGVALLRRPGSGLDMIHAFVKAKQGLDSDLGRYAKWIKPDGMIWISWPKKSSGVATDLSEGVVREAALKLGLVDVKVCAVDETWSGLKLVIRKALRPKGQTG